MKLVADPASVSLDSTFNDTKLGIMLYDVFDPCAIGKQERATSIPGRCFSASDRAEGRMDLDPYPDRVELIRSRARKECSNMFLVKLLYTAILRINKLLR